MNLTEHELAVCAKILRAEDGPLLRAVRMVLVERRSNSHAIDQNPPLTKQQLSNALRRYEAWHNIILSGYARQPEACISTPSLGDD